jgi:hypothetical protein
MKNAAWVALVVGFGLAAVRVALGPRVDPAFDALFVVAPILLVLGGGVLVAASASEWFRRYRPSEEGRQALEAEASRLGMRWLGRDSSGIDRAPTFIERPGFLRAMNRPLSTWFHPTFDHVFSGQWKALEAHVFDYSSASGENRVDWTCVLLPSVADMPDVLIKRRSVLVSGLKNLLGLGRASAEVAGSEFDGAFEVKAKQAARAREVLGPDARRHLLEKTPYRVVVENRGGRLLYCTPKLPLEERQTLLDLATELREALDQHR